MSTRGKEKSIQCLFCKEEMSYIGHTSVPEVHITISPTSADGGLGDAEMFYAHMSCWNGVKENTTEVKELDMHPFYNMYECTSCGGPVDLEEEPVFCIHCGRRIVGKIEVDHTIGKVEDEENEWT